ncbi:MAG: acetylglutamate kinase [Rikenellaceae bacterium]|jgi:acetylglutamate kinase|nr:acetylglutamate kinase [Rikenellaceae bacterium]
MLKIVKIGGNIVDNPEKLDSFLAGFAALEGSKILVHGGGKIATAVSKGLGVEARMIDGRRVTDAETLKVVTMVYAGLVNKTIVAKLQALGCNAFGLCGADGNLIPSVKRNPVPIDFGYVGDPVAGRFGIATARTLIDAGFSPVVAPVTHSGDGTLLNTNADTIAQTVAVGLATHYDVELVYCFEKPGVLADVNDEGSVIPHITPASFVDLRAQGVVSDGMIPKLENAFAAIAGGVRAVVICGSERLLTSGYGGTTCAG